MTAPGAVPRRRALLALLVVLLAAGAVISLTLGKYRLPPLETLRFLLAQVVGGDDFPTERARLLDNLLFGVRWPRVAAAMGVGAVLASSGAAFQAVFVNPLASPGLLGVLAGASFGAALGMILFSSWVAVQLSAFLWGLGAVAAALGLARLYGRRGGVMLVLGGVISQAFFSALVSLVKYAADPYNQLPGIVYWLMGSLAASDRTSVRLSLAMVGITLLLCLHGRALNALAMGDEEARALGVPAGRVRLTVIALSALGGALTVASAGVIGWVGLLVPHLARLLFGPDNQTLLVASALLGALYLLIIDNVCRLAFPVEAPLGVLTALFGIPCFALAARSARQGWR